MKLFLIAFAVIAAVAADVSHLPSNEYLPPVQEVAQPSNEYLAPAETAEIAEQGSLADDGYRYKTHRRVVLRRHRRDVSHLPSNEYLPPQEEAVAPSNEYLAPVADEQGSAAEDGYRYKTLRRRVVRRHRRDVNELPSNDYLPPAEEAAPAEVDESADQGDLADDGYRYKTHRRVVLRRHRRDVSEIAYLPPVAAAAPVNEYLPPAAPAAAPAPVPAPVEVAAPVEEAEPAHELADDGYRYKTHRRVVLRRHRRDVNEIAYLPPVQAAAPSNEYLPPAAPAAAPAPIQISAPAPVPVEVAAPVEEAEPAHELAADGYRYKTQRRVVIRRHRRDVSHLPSNEYLPPQEAQTLVAPTNEYLPPVDNSVVEQGSLAEDGYRYKTLRRRVVRRHRRDVSESYLPPVAAAAPANEYLPPAAPAAAPAPAPAPVLDVAVTADEPAPAHELADDGYRYKTQRRVVIRRH